MQATTLLLRQVHPNFVKDGHILSVAFRPFPKDEGLLSVYHGDLIAANDAWAHFTGTLGRQSAGVWAVTKQETDYCCLPARPDTEGTFAEHAVIDFKACTKSEQGVKSKILAQKAESRGCLHPLADPVQITLQ